MRRVLRGTQGEPAPPRHASSHCCSEPSGCRSAHPNIWPAPSWEAAPFKASLLSIPPKQRGRQSDIDFVLPNYEQLPRPQQSLAAGRLPPQDFQEHLPSCGIPTATAIPAGVLPEKTAEISV